MIVSLTCNSVYYPSFDTENPPVKVPEPIILAAVKVKLCDQIDLASIAARSNIVDDGSDPEVSRQRYQEAVNYLQTATPNDQDYPFLYIEAGRLDENIEQFATEVITQYEAEQVALAKIESDRAFGKKQVSAAKDQQSAIFAETQAKTQIDEVVNDYKTDTD
ncbi:hypothetical protein [Piscirickettsia litoralis]|uniref:DUF4398 domain-containing protein n=1 Tax=Piscirickettsia litoralis TaxID=1891921 RepID=A0ABX2ZX09_9GAMM|nr:hypothetical protein [Piscirickettsia litoralis]ODN41161.1 hypothetical protein BGC07_17970 [Piscirickettsia litoralis]